MRTSLSMLVLAAVLALPAEAQFRDAARDTRSASRLYEASGIALSKLFNPSVFRMSHSFEMSAGSFGGRGYSMGMYTNTMAWQFSEKFAASMDVSVAYSPQTEAAAALGLRNDGPKVFLRSADIAWRPSKKFQLHLQVRQNPYGHRMGPYGGYMGPYGGYRSGYGYAPYGGRSPFWRDDWR